MDKTKITLKQTMDPAAAAKYLEDFLAGLKSGGVTVSQGEETLTLAMPALIEVEVSAKVKKGSQKFSLELEWETPAPMENVSITGAAG